MHLVSLFVTLPMIDTVSGFLSTHEEGRLLASLRITNKRTFASGERRVIGYMDNMRFEACFAPDGFLYQVRYAGSLSKFHHKNGWGEMTRKGTQLAVEEMSDRTGLDFGTGNLYRVDVAGNLFMKQSVSSYLTLLGECPRMQKGGWGDSVYYSNKQRRTVFYDKVKELKQKRQDIPPIYEGRNILRFEMRLLKRIRNQLKVESLTLSSLCDERVYMQLLNRWKNEYFGIRKEQKPRLMKAVNVKEFMNHLALLGLANIGGEAGALEMLDQARMQGDLNKQQYHRLKAKLRDLGSCEGLTMPFKEVKELDGKVERAVRYYR